jgi:hypothetical protein
VYRPISFHAKIPLASPDAKCDFQKTPFFRFAFLAPAGCVADGETGFIRERLRAENGDWGICPNKQYSGFWYRNTLLANLYCAFAIR